MKTAKQKFNEMCKGEQAHTLNALGTSLGIKELANYNVGLFDLFGNLVTVWYNKAMNEVIMIRMENFRSVDNFLDNLKLQQDGVKAEI